MEHKQLDEQLRNKATDPQTTPEELFEIATDHPELYRELAANPAAYPELLQWLGEQSDPVLAKIIEQREKGKYGESAIKAALEEANLSEADSAQAVQEEPAAQEEPLVTEVTDDPEANEAEAAVAESDNEAVETPSAADPAQDEPQVSAEETTVLNVDKFDGEATRLVAEPDTPVQTDKTPQAAISPTAGAEETAHIGSNPIQSEETVLASAAQVSPQRAQAPETPILDPTQVKYPENDLSETQYLAPTATPAQSGYPNADSYPGQPHGYGATYPATSYPAPGAAPMGAANPPGGSYPPVQAGYAPATAAAYPASAGSASPAEQQTKKSWGIAVLSVLVVLALLGTFVVGYWVFTSKNDGSSQQATTTNTGQLEDSQSNADTEENSEPESDETGHLEETTPTVVKPAPDGATEASTITLPSGNIGCSLSGDTVTCSINVRQWASNGMSDCPSGPGTISVGSGEAQLQCGSAVGIGGGTTVGYGQSVKSGNVGCSVSEAGANCWNVNTGHGFTMRAKEWSAY